MNTPNVMAVQPQVGDLSKTQGNGKMTAKKAGTAADKQTFGETMGKLDQKGTNAQSATAKDTQGSTADCGNVMEDVPQDPLASVLAAAQQGNGAQPTAEVQPQPTSELSAVVLTMSAEAQDAFVDPVVTADTDSANLQSLLPQSAEDGAKSRDFLAMLSGQQLKNTSAEKQTQTAEPSGNRPQQAATMLEAQLLSQQSAQDVGDRRSQQQNLPGTILQTAPQQAAEPLSQPVVLQTMLRQPSVQPLVQGSAEQKPEQGILDGINLSVEDETPVMPLRMDARQMLSQQNPQNPQSGQQNASPQEFVKTMTAGVQPLPEEAAAEQAPAAGSSPNTNTVSMFQQSLQESITSTSGSPVHETSQPQTDFDIPRQIIDQARLIRRAEDTQMIIKLNPEHLGELTLKVSVTQNGSVNAAFHSDNAQVRAVIENSLVQLRQELNNQGLKVDSVEVYAGLADGQLPQEQGQQAWQNQQGGNNRIRGIAMDAEDYAEEAENLTAAASQEAGESAMDGVDYRI